jgi:hypothetical protein
MRAGGLVHDAADLDESSAAAIYGPPDTAA